MALSVAGKAGAAPRRAVARGAEGARRAQREAGAVARRGLLAGAAAAPLLPGLWAPPAADALISGYEKDSGGYSYAVLSHETPKFADWKAFFDDAWGEQGPPDWGVVRTIVCKGKGVETDGDKVGVIIVFPEDNLKLVTPFYDQDKNPLWAEGREAGWLTGTFTQTYATPKIWRGFPGDTGPPSLEGKAIASFQAGVTIPFDAWLPDFTSADSDKFHARMGVIGSEAGLSLPGSDNGEGAIDVAHWFSTYPQAARMCKMFNEHTGKFAFFDSPDAPFKEPIVGTPFTIVSDKIDMSALSA